MSVNHRGRDLNDIEKQGKSNWRIGNLFLLNLIKMKFELAAVEMVESSLLERVETLALLGFGVQWIITIVVLLSLFCLRKNFVHDISQIDRSIFGIPGSVKTSLAAAMSMNFFSAFFLASSSVWKLSGCHCCACFLNGITAIAITSNVYHIENC